jgi:polyhydroxybutyrate depolymerase
MRTAVTLAIFALLGCDGPMESGVDSGEEERPDTGPRLRADGGPRVDGGPRTDAHITPIGSAGCGMADPVRGAREIEVGGDTGAYHVSLPADYDPARAYPLGFGFHGFGRTHDNCRMGDCAGFQNAMEDDAILVYIKSFTDGWDGEARDQNVDLFEAVLDTVLAEYCVDEGRVFVAGTSSGAHFVNVLGCRFGDRLLATIPVAGYLPERDCTGTVAALVIHGVDDTSFEAGQEARDFWVAQNGCTSETVPAIADLHPRVVAERESHECADYVGCAAGTPVRWCEHSEGGYDGSTHGWPLFGGDEIWSFVSGF